MTRGAPRWKDLVGGLRGGGDGGLPVGLVDEDGAEVADHVNHAEDEALEREHGQVRAVVVAVDFAASVVVGGVIAVKEGGRGGAVRGEDGLALLLLVAGGGLEQIVYDVRGVHFDVDGVDEDDENDEDDRSVDVRGLKESAKAKREMSQKPNATLLKASRCVSRRDTKKIRRLQAGDAFGKGREGSVYLAGVSP